MRIAALPRFIFIVGAPRCGTNHARGLFKEHSANLLSLVKSRISSPARHARARLDARATSSSANISIAITPVRRRSRHTGRWPVSYLYVRRTLPALSWCPSEVRHRATRPDDDAALDPRSDQIYRRQTIDAFEDAWHAIPDRAAGVAFRDPATSRAGCVRRGGQVGSYVEAFSTNSGASAASSRCSMISSPTPESNIARCAPLPGSSPCGDRLLAQAREPRFSLRGAPAIAQAPPSFARDYLAGKQFAQRERSSNAHRAKTR